MSLEYCRECDRNIDTDWDEHFEHFESKDIDNYAENLVNELKGGKKHEKN